MLGLAASVASLKNLNKRDQNNSNTLKKDLKSTVRDLIYTIVKERGLGYKFAPM